MRQSNRWFLGRTFHESRFCMNKCRSQLDTFLHLNMVRLDKKAFRCCCCCCCCRRWRSFSRLEVSLSWMHCNVHLSTQEDICSDLSEVFKYVQYIAPNIATMRHYDILQMSAVWNLAIFWGHRSLKCQIVIITFFLFHSSVNCPPIRPFLYYD